jgi:hypothetical protein
MNQRPVDPDYLLQFSFPTWERGNKATTKPMSKSPTTLAQEFLEDVVSFPQLLWIHDFPDDESAHDDDLTNRLYADFFAEFERVCAELSQKHGSPLRTGRTDDNLIPLGGLFRFALWSDGGRQFWVAAAHEDRGLPILLMIGRVTKDD